MTLTYPECFNAMKEIMFTECVNGIMLQRRGFPDDKIRQFLACGIMTDSEGLDITDSDTELSTLLMSLSHQLDRINAIRLFVTHALTTPDLDKSGYLRTILSM